MKFDTPLNNNNNKKAKQILYKKTLIITDSLAYFYFSI